MPQSRTCVSQKKLQWKSFSRQNVLFSEILMRLWPSCSVLIYTACRLIHVSFHSGCVGFINSSTSEKIVRSETEICSKHEPRRVDWTENNAGEQSTVSHELGLFEWQTHNIDNSPFPNHSSPRNICTQNTGRLVHLSLRISQLHWTEDDHVLRGFPSDNKARILFQAQN